MHFHWLTLTRFKHVTTPVTYNFYGMQSTITGDNVRGFPSAYAVKRMSTRPTKP